METGEASFPRCIAKKSMPSSKISEIIKFWLPVLFWCGVIYYLSSIPNLKSDLPNQLDLILRKAAHMAEYGILTFLFFRAAVQNLEFAKSSMYSALFSLTFAASDEYHQLFVLGRHGSLFDVFIDGIGVLFTVLLVYKRIIK